MLKIIHRVNTIQFLKKIPKHYGVEVDVRGYKNRLILNHEPLMNGELLEKYLKQYAHAFIIFNIKEAGIEDEVLKLVKKYKIKNYFLLDVEFPYVYRAVRKGVRAIAVRYSEDEPIEQILRYRKLVDWVWIDTNTKLPLTPTVIKKLKGLKTCLVSPERWNRPKEIVLYQKKIKRLNFTLDAVMTEFKYAELW